MNNVSMMMIGVRSPFEYGNACGETSNSLHHIIERVYNFMVAHDTNATQHRQNAQILANHVWKHDFVS